MNPNILRYCTCILFYILTASGCTTTVPIVKKPAPIPSLPEQIQAQLPQDYHIQPGNKLTIKFIDYPELNETILVRPDGRFSIQFAHEIMAANKTPAELTDEIVTKVGSEVEELDKSRVAVIMNSFTPEKIYVGGEVTEPQLIDLEQKKTALQAIFQARGFTKEGRISEVILIRRQADYTPIAMSLNLSDALDGTNMSQDILLMPNDIIFVPKTQIADINQWIEKYIRKMMPLQTMTSFSYDFSR